MDAFKKVLGGDKQNASGAQPNANAGVAGGQGGDYGDKGKFLPFYSSFPSPSSSSYPSLLSCAAFVNKKYMNDKFSKDQLEKVTDSARAGFEKATGNKVPDKFSN
ncbi:hypothetical protein F5Y14DRAFT_452942 [Nemania sp. NC0429]|nr:hypothetical protein F5Y14DRAFT_452942 [Nemania sp. NC0429]